jgi:hypothetical protein
MKPALIIAVVLASLIYLALWSYSQQTPTNSQKETNGQISPSGSEVHPATETTAPQYNPPHWYKAPECILVIVGILTAFVVGWQAYETRRAVSAQIIGTRPFLAIKDWFPIINNETDTMDIQIDVINIGKIPVILHGITLRMSSQVVQVRDKAFVVPEQPQRIQVSITLKAETAKKLRDGGIIGFPLYGTIDYSSDFSRNVEQPFSGTLMIGPKLKSFF